MHWGLRKSSWKHRRKVGRNGLSGGGRRARNPISGSEAAEKPRMRRTKMSPVFGNKESVCDQAEGSFRGEVGVDSRLQWAEREREQRKCSIVEAWLQGRERRP